MALRRFSPLSMATGRRVAIPEKIVKHWDESWAWDPCVAINRRHNGPARMRFDVEARTRQAVVLMPMMCGSGSGRGCFYIASRSLPHNVKAKTGRALVTLVHCDARIHYPNLAPLFDDVQLNSTRRLEAKGSGEEGGRANRVRRLPDSTSRLPRRSLDEGRQDVVSRERLG